jgi:hypothetical protein
MATDTRPATPKMKNKDENKWRNLEKSRDYIVTRKLQSVIIKILRHKKNPHP